MPPMIGETLLLYLDPRSTCGRSDFADNIIGQLPCHSLQQASRGALIVYIRVYPVPNLATGGRGIWGEGWECVQQVMCVLCWSVEDPRAWVLIPAWAVFENRRRSQWVCRCGTEVVACRNPLFLSIQGHCWGPEDRLWTEACQRSRRPHGPSKTCRASPQEMYKLTRWVYPVNVT